ncbi:MAG: 3'-5' exonuclease [Bacteroidota bacterium]|nr:3'-5' exonuclease [Bacteroidota bacterium]
MALQLNRPIVFIDLETTGTNLATDRVIEIAIVKILPDKTKQVKHKIVNPQISIPKSASDIHGITNEKVKDAPIFKEVANELKQFIDNADLSGYNSNRFDIPLLVEEFLRSGIELEMTNRRMLDVQQIFHMMEKRTLGAAYKFYCEKDLINAHSAEADASATWEILEAQLTRYGHLGETLDTILQFTGEEKYVDFARRFVMDNDVETFNFGKHKGRAVCDVLKAEPQYYDWMMKGDFPLHTKQKLTEIFNRTLLKNKLPL